MDHVKFELVGFFACVMKLTCLGWQKVIDLEVVSREICDLLTRQSLVEIVFR